MFAFGALSGPVANWGVLGFLEASTIYNFIYSPFSPTAGSGPETRGAGGRRDRSFKQNYIAINGICARGKDAQRLVEKKRPKAKQNLVLVSSAKEDRMPSYDMEALVRAVLIGIGVGCVT